MWFFKLKDKPLTRFVVEPQADLTAKELFHIVRLVLGVKRFSLRQNQFDNLTEELKRHIKIVKNNHL